MADGSKIHGRGGWACVEDLSEDGSDKDEEERFVRGGIFPLRLQRGCRNAVGRDKQRHG